MTTFKTLLVLANSIKHAPGVCIAGREIQSDRDSYTIGPWIRPVSAHGEGELWPSETEFANGRQPKVFDFVAVSLSGPSGDRLQPENWQIVPSRRWRNLTSQFVFPSMDLLVETPSELWLEPGGPSDRVSNSFLQRHPPIQSLYLVKPQSVRGRFEWSVWEGQSRLRRRVIFRFRGMEYNLAVTDPAFLERHRTKVPGPGAGPIEFPVRSSDSVYLCVSLAPEFNGFHYKVVATVIEA